MLYVPPLHYAICPECYTDRRYAMQFVLNAIRPAVTLCDLSCALCNLSYALCDSSLAVVLGVNSVKFMELGLGVWNMEYGVGVWGWSWSLD